MVRQSYGALSLCGFLFLLAGCRTTLGPWADLPPPAAVLSTAEPVWQQLATRRRIFQNLQGLARVRLYTTVRSVEVEDVVVVLQGLEAMRLEGIGPFGQPLFLLISDGRRFSLYTPQEARLIVGAASAENLSRVFGIELAPAALQYMLIGDVPLATLPVEGRFRYLSRQNLYVWEGQEPEQLRNYRIWFEPYHLSPVRFEVAQPSGEIVLQVQYEDFRQLDDFALPYRITIKEPLVERRVIWRYDDLQLNVGVPPALFRMRVPAGTERIELE